MAVQPKDVEHILAHADPQHACNQGSLIRLASGELLLGYNEERAKRHRDSGQSCLIRSRDGGRTWAPASRTVVWPYSETQGNWDCAFAQLSDGEILMHTRVCHFLDATALRGGADQVIGGPPPGCAERFKRQTGYALCRSSDGGRTWSEARPVNTSPICDSGLGPYIVGGSGAGHIVELPDGNPPAAARHALARVAVAGGRDAALLRAALRRPRPQLGVLGDDRVRRGERPRLGRARHDSAARRPAGLPDANAGAPRPLRQPLVRRVRGRWRELEPPGAHGPLGLSRRRAAARRRPRARRVRLPARTVGRRACLSPDSRSWDARNEFAVREGGAAPPDFREYWHIGYPTVALAADGAVVVAYHEYTAEPTPIQHMRVTRFRL